MCKTYKYDFKNNKEVSRHNAECVANFRSQNARKVTRIPLDKVKFIYPEHVHGDEMPRAINKYKKSGKEVNTPLIVKRISDEEYGLIYGWSGYKIAETIGQKEVNAIIVNHDRETLNDIIGVAAEYEVCRIESFLIPALFDITFITPNKLYACKDYDMEHHAQLKPIVVNQNMVILDGYAQYVYNRNMGKEYCEIMVVNE